MFGLSKRSFSFQTDALPLSPSPYTDKHNRCGSPKLQPGPKTGPFLLGLNANLISTQHENLGGEEPVSAGILFVLYMRMDEAFDSIQNHPRHPIAETSHRNKTLRIQFLNGCGRGAVVENLGFYATEFGEAGSQISSGSELTDTGDSGAAKLKGRAVSFISRGQRVSYKVILLTLLQGRVVFDGPNYARLQCQLAVDESDGRVRVWTIYSLKA